MATAGPAGQTGSHHRSGSVSKEEFERLRDELRDTLAEQKQLRKEFQEFEKAVQEREKYKDKLWRERLAFLSIIVALGVGLITQVV